MHCSFQELDIEECSSMTLPKEEDGGQGIPIAVNISGRQSRSYTQRTNTPESLVIGQQCT